jgi:hypothetical protein
MMNVAHNHSIFHCISCNTLNTAHEVCICCYCGNDNEAWFRWLKLGLWPHLDRFLLSNIWGWLALLSLLLPLISWRILHFPLSILTITVMTISLFINLLGLLLLFINRDELWIDELTRRVSTHHSLGLLQVGGAGFLIFVLTWMVIGIGWSLEVWRGESWRFNEDWQVIWLGFAFTGETLAAGLYSLHAYGQWLLKSFPHPVFLNEASLVRLVEPLIKERVKTKSVTDVFTLRIINSTRATDAGLNLNVRTVVKTEKSLEKFLIQETQYWRVNVDKWGDIKLCEPDGPPKYVRLNFLSILSVATLTTSTSEGEIIQPLSPSSLTVEEAILIAFTPGSS